MTPIKVFIVDDHSLIVEGIKLVIQNDDSFLIAGKALNAKDCITFFNSSTADVVILDINLPDMNGFDLCKTLRENYPSLKIIALTTYNQASYIKAMIQNGANGYLLKNASPLEIKESILSVLKGKTYFSEEVKQILEHSNSNDKPLLTRRESEILNLIVEGKTNTEISSSLFISIDTVDSHRKNIYSKLQVKNTAMLIKVAIEKELLIKLPK